MADDSCNLTDDELTELLASIPEPEPRHALREAIATGDVDLVRAAIDAGEEVRYRRPKGYDALIDAAYSAGGEQSLRLLDLLSLLVERGADVHGVSEYGEPALSVLSRFGCFDAVGFLLRAGADRSRLNWTPLIEAVALGTIDDVKSALAAGPELESRDGWSRTAFLTAILAGDLEKAELLRAAGADVTAVGHCGAPPHFYAVRGLHAAMARWLIELGADVGRTDDFGGTALMEAVLYRDIECVNVLLAAGADVSIDVNGTALSRTFDAKIALRLLDAGSFSSFVAVVYRVSV
jgi:ankyrin repeat protein